VEEFGHPVDLSVPLTWLGTRIRPLARMRPAMRDETVPGSLLVSFPMALVPFAHVRVFPDADVFWGCQRGGYGGFVFGEMTMGRGDGGGRGYGLNAKARRGGDVDRFVRVQAEAER
jgi:hypothetical protein